MRTILENGSGEAVREFVLRQLDWAFVTDLHVSIDKGAVTLAGVVTGYFAKAAAGEVVKSLPGVKAVANRLEVEPSIRAVPGDVAAAAWRCRENEMELPGFGWSKCL